MRGKISVILLAILVFALCVLPQWSQAQEGEQNNQLLWIREVAVKPALVNEYVAAMKDLVAFFKEHNFPYGSYVWDDGKFHYYYVSPVDSYQAVMTIYEAQEALMNTWETEQAQKFGKTMLTTISSYKDYFIEYLANYSYIPENPRLKDEEMTYATWDIFHIPLDKEAEYFKLIEEYMPSMKDKNISESMLFYTGRVGTERPFYFGLGFGKNAADFWAANAKMWEQLGEKGAEFYRKSMKLIDKREFKQFWSVTSLNYWPEK